MSENRQLLIRFAIISEVFCTDVVVVMPLQGTADRPCAINAIKVM